MTIKCLRQNKSLPAGHPSNPSAQVGPGNAEEGTLMQTNVQLCITTMSIHQSIQLIVHHWLGLKGNYAVNLNQLTVTLKQNCFKATLVGGVAERSWACADLRSRSSFPTDNHWPSVPLLLAETQPRFDRIIRTVITDCQTQFYRHHNWVIRGQHMRIHIIIVARTLFGSHSTFGR